MRLAPRKLWKVHLLSDAGLQPALANPFLLAASVGFKGVNLEAAFDFPHLRLDDRELALMPAPDLFLNPGQGSLGVSSGRELPAA